jgi:hypothetical protein
LIKQMGLTGFNNARRQREAALSAQLSLESPVTPEALLSEPECTLTATPALQAINGATTAVDIAVLPTIGKSAAEIILGNRPEGGYQSMCQLWALNEEILNRPFRTNKESVESYTGE